MLQNATVLLGAGGGPLTWVAVDVLRALQRAGAQVRVVLSAETEIFVPALTFQALTGGEVVPADAMYGTMVGGHFRPLSTWVESVVAMVVVPATPALLAKAVSGYADEALVRALLLHRGPTILAYPGQAAVYQHALMQHTVENVVGNVRFRHRRQFLDLASRIEDMHAILIAGKTNAGIADIVGNDEIELFMAYLLSRVG